MSTIIDYTAEIGWKIDWQDAAALPDADTIFLDNSLPNRGLNRKASNYSQVNDYDLYAVIEAVVSKDGVNTTYRAISALSKANDYDEPSTSPRDFDCDITIHDVDSGANIGAFIPNREVIMRATWTLVSGNIADYAGAWGVHRIEIYQNTGYNIYEFSSTRANLTTNPLTSASGLLSVTYNGNTIITECRIDGTQLNPGTSYKVSARLGLPNVSYTPPTSEITDIVADTETGITAFVLNLTGGTALSSADTLEIKVYNNASGTLLYTITGNYGQDLSAFTGAFAAYLGGVVGTANHTFNKLQWAADEGLINPDAITLRFDITITQAATGLTSNTATGVFDVELQDAEYIGDLRYFDTDGRKLYSANLDGANAVAVALDLTLKYSEELFGFQSGAGIPSVRVIENSTYGAPWSKLLVSEVNLAASPYQWLIEADTSDNGVTWGFTALINNIAGAGHTGNLPLKDDIRTANGEPVYWVGFDLPTPNVLYMVYYDGAAWQAVDFSSKITGLLTAAAVRVLAGISYTGDIYGYACANGTTGEKQIFRMLQTSGTKTTVADFTDPANWANATVMCGDTTPGTADGNGAAAQFANPYGMIMIDDDGTRPTEIWVTDGNNYAIRKLTYAAGTDNYDVDTIVGTIGTSGDTSGTGTAAVLGDVRGICSDGTNVYIGDLTNRKIKKVVIATLAVTTFSGTGDNNYRVATRY